MKLDDLSHQSSASDISKIYQSYFGRPLNIDTASRAGLQRALSRVQSVIAECRTTSEFHQSEQNPRYLRAMIAEQAIAARLDELGSVGTVNTATGTTTTGSIATKPAPKPHELQQRMQQIKDPKMKELLRKASSGQQVSPDDQKKLVALAADQTVTEDTPARKAEIGQLMSKLAQVINSVETVDQHRAAEKYANLVIKKIRDRSKSDPGFAGISELHDYLRAINQDLRNKLREITLGNRMNESREYSIKYVQEDDVWAVVDSVGNRVESFIEKHEAAQEARKLNAGSSKAPTRHRHVNSRGDLEESSNKPAKVDRTKEPNAKSERYYAKKAATKKAEPKGVSDSQTQVQETYEGPNFPNGVASAAKYSKDFGPILSKLSKVIDSVKTHDQLDSANNYAELVISHIRRELKKRKGSMGDNEVYGYMTAIDDALAEKERSISRFSESKRLVINAGTNRKDGLREGKLDDLKDKKAAKDDWFDGKNKAEPAKKKVAGKQYGGSKQKDDTVTESADDMASLKAKAKELSDKMDAIVKDGGKVGLNDPLSVQYKKTMDKIKKLKSKKVNESANLRSASTAKLVEFYRKHRASGSDRVKMVESELLRRKKINESKKSTRRLVTEGEVQQAQVVLAAQDMVDQIQKMIEQASSAQFKDLPALVSQIRLDQGPDQSAQFNQAVTAAMTSLLQALAGAKEQMEGAVDVVTGKAPAGPAINPGDDAAPATDVPPAPSDDAAADLDLDKETGDITGFGRERR